MSGGSFNYACFKVEDNQVFDAISDIRAIENYLRRIDQHDAADEVLLYLAELETHQRRLAVLGRRIAPLLQAAEWVCSSDWSLNTINDEYRKLMGLESKNISPR